MKNKVLIKKKDLLKNFTKDQLLPLYNKEEVVEKMLAVDERLQEIFLKNLPDKLSERDIMERWATDWKKFGDNGWAKCAEEISYFVFKKIINLEELISYWESTPNQHLRNVIKRVVIELLPKRRLKLNLELLRKLYLVTNQNHPIN